MDIKELSDKIDNLHEENKKRAKKAEIEYIGWIAIALAVATTPNIANAVIPASLFIIGVGLLLYTFLSPKVKEK